MINNRMGRVEEQGEGEWGRDDGTYRNRDNKGKHYIFDDSNTH
jgi:hypothetical protein